MIAESGAEIALVLDDYHLVSNPEVHRGVEQLITRRPANLIVVVSARSILLSTRTSAVRGELSEIRAADLRFERDESAWLLDAETLGLDRDAVEQLTTRTEGGRPAWYWRRCRSIGSPTSPNSSTRSVVTIIWLPTT
ncbi:MAG: hypothetical protein R2710_08435 [Acidimicrobiales bacterium]